MNTILKDRVLWFDGTQQIPSLLVESFILRGVNPEQIIVTESSPDIEQYNILSDIPISCTKDVNIPFDFSWNIPPQYQTMDLSAHVLTLFKKSQLPQTLEYTNRINAEFIEIERFRLTNLFKTLVYVINTLRDNSQLWGIGRGSSCASLILYLLGVHCIDPIKYNIDLSEFFHD